MYIASSIHGDDDFKNYSHDQDEQDSDDSLASDASSGPGYQGTSRAAEDEEDQNNGLKKKKKLSLKKPISEKKKKKKEEDKKEAGFVYSTRTGADTITTTSQTGSKAPISRHPIKHAYTGDILHQPSPEE
ncbi:hypothetical protein HS088_TW15G00122 [Tripterygium wilfordii]|uniref:Uncharacterized protein n=1 Tax=Tripterygium wilfordii TaxID=458696 RepID=A0A7J7CKP8_TRIWF|nr:hypothetical protein HS088_TW15G00122 [Tripterygium wilfordii]